MSGGKLYTYKWRRPKYNAVPQTVDGFKFDSKMEAEFYRYLMVLKGEEAIIHVEVHPFATLGPGDRVKLDFLVFWADGSLEYVDVKGARATRAASEFRRLQKRWSHPVAPLRAVTLHRGKWLDWS